ncbi:MAG TPA: hypothetical protein DF712_22065 [Balneola sp.]|nr:hypothetical protein [Balneola sp.]|tara:strand:+ start:118 stop:504 length:387 start_codon:yes stop_codon:yes gene_type:complete
MKDENIKKRITEAIEDIGGNSSKLARMIGVTPNYLASVVTNPNKGVSATLFKGFAEAGMNLNWLVKGQSEMWMNDSNGNAVATLALVQSKLDDALDLISKLEYYVDRLESLNQKQSEGSHETTKETIN